MLCVRVVRERPNWPAKFGCGLKYPRAAAHSWWPRHRLDRRLPIVHETLVAVCHFPPGFRRGLQRPERRADRGAFPFLGDSDFRRAGHPACRIARRIGGARIWQLVAPPGETVERRRRCAATPSRAGVAAPASPSSPQPRGGGRAGCGRLVGSLSYPQRRMPERAGGREQIYLGQWTTGVLGQRSEIRPSRNTPETTVRGVGWLSDRLGSENCGRRPLGEPATVLERYKWRRVIVRWVDYSIRLAPALVHSTSRAVPIAWRPGTLRSMRTESLAGPVEAFVQHRRSSKGD